MLGCVYIEPGLLKDGTLRVVRFLKELEESWVLQGDSPRTNNIDEYEKVDKENALQMYPELKELFDLNPEKNISFRKGINSGRWYDFL